MRSWSEDDLRRIVEADDLHISPLREDGKTFGTPTWIWCVAVEGDLFVRGYNGQNSRWFQAALRQRAGQIQAADMTCDVAFEPVSGDINDRIDEAYQSKYARSPYLAPMISPRARSATIRISPFSATS
jgi:hypothetical protein